MIQINGLKVTSDANKYVHRLGTNHYGNLITLFLNETKDSFEEVDEIPVVNYELEDLK